MILNLRFVFFITITLIISCIMLHQNKSDVFSSLDISEVTVFCDTQNFSNQEYSLSGDGFSFSCSTEEYLNLENKHLIDGISFCTLLCPNEIINKLNAKIQSSQSLQSNEIQIFYCFIENSFDCILIDNKKVNMQIAFSNGVSTLGFPIILGSY